MTQPSSFSPLSSKMLPIVPELAAKIELIIYNSNSRANYFRVNKLFIICFRAESYSSVGGSYVVMTYI